MLSQADSNHHNFSFATFEPPQFSPLRRKTTKAFSIKRKPSLYCPRRIRITTIFPLRHKTTKASSIKRKPHYVVPGGFEPPQTEPKTVVLPLHHRTIVSAKVVIFYSTAKFFTCFFTFTFLSICKRATSQEFSQ